LIVDDHRLFADAIRAALIADGVESVTAVTCGADAIAEVLREAPDVALVDIGLPGESGLQVGRRILELNARIKVIALTALDSPKLVQEAVRKGFHGFLMKDARVDQFLDAIRAVLDGEIVLPPRPESRAPVRRSESDARDILLADHLTPRELEVLDLLTAGADTKRIAEQLRVAPNTVRTHVQSVLSKLQVHSRLEAAAFAARYARDRQRAAR
jgi:two-component system nitrate/nitrite response regulator NarL